MSTHDEFDVTITDDDGSEYRWHVVSDGRTFDRLVELLGEPDTTRA